MKYKLGSILLILIISNYSILLAKDVEAKGLIGKANEVCPWVCVGYGHWNGQWSNHYNNGRTRTNGVCGCEW